MGLGPGTYPMAGPAPAGRRRSAPRSSRSSRACTRALVVVRGGQQHPRADQLELEPGRGGPAHLREPLVDQVGGAAQLGGAEDATAWACIRSTTSAGASMSPFSAASGTAARITRSRSRSSRSATKRRGSLPALDHPVHDLEGRGAVARGERRPRRSRAATPSVYPSSEVAMAYVTPSVARAGEQLVHDGHRVTHGSGTGPHDQRQHAVLDGDVLPAADLAEVVPQGPRAARAGTGSGAYATGSSR